jgi:hypothetical protein
MADDLRDELLRREPLLPLIEEAVDRDRRSVPEPVRNPANGRTFAVEFDAALATLTVLHDGRVVYRSRRARGGDRRDRAPP